VACGIQNLAREIKKRKKLIVKCLVVAMTLGVVSFTVAESMPEPDGDALWHHISKVSPYTEWSFWPDHQGMQEGNAPHGPFHKSFVNKQALESKSAPLQYGAIQVKENYSPDHELKALTVMYKVEGYNSEGGDWFWAKYSPDGETLKAGKIAGCIGCHRGRADNDFVLVHELK